MKNIAHRVLALVAIFGLSAISITAQAEDNTIAGTFAGASNHVTTGTVTIEKQDGQFIVTLHDDFSLDGAPDPKLGFGNSGHYDGTTTFHVLKKLNGKQVYQLPTSIDPAAYNEIYIWCETYSVPLGVASIR